MASTRFLDPRSGHGPRATWRAALALWLCLWLAWGPTAEACSPAGHAVVAIASLGKLARSKDPATRRLAKMLHKYRWVVYWGAEGPDVVQRARGYRFSHWFPLYTVQYEHPERFDLKAAQPFYTALLRHAYRADYGVTPDDAAKHGIVLARPPRRDWGEVGLAYACGYVTHLLADYFCHAPAKTWWDKEPKLRQAVLDVAKSKSYGVVQEFYAVMLWERFLKDYGVPADGLADFRRGLARHHVDNGVLPYCALAGSKAFYADWPPGVLPALDPSKYDACAAPMLRRGGAGFARCVDHESRRVHAMLEHMGLSLDDAIKQSNDLTGWRQTYARVIDMIIQVWGDAARQIDLAEPDDTNVVLAAEREPAKAGLLIEVPAKRGARVNLALHRDWAIRRYRTRKGEEGPVTGWGEKPSGARFDLAALTVEGRSRIAIVTDGPWLNGAGGVSGTFRLRLPKTGGKVIFRALVGLHGERTRSDGVSFRVIVADAARKPHRLLDQHSASHTLRPVVIDLSRFAGQEIKLSLISDAGPNDDPGWDWGAWVEPLLLVE
ncbi:MAG: zinc dependent phospholipase C family protein [Candidatus Brocadiae bacterium]|nr:zinc dependent phospholipase C family protein [Candidatus Brocadiia bacterium]